MKEFFHGSNTAQSDIPHPVPFIPGLKALAAWIEAAIEGDRT